MNNKEKKKLILEQIRDIYNIVFLYELSNKERAYLFKKLSHLEHDITEFIK